MPGRTYRDSDGDLFIYLGPNNSRAWVYLSKNDDATPHSYGYVTEPLEELSPEDAAEAIQALRKC